jgi:hypothetical protein
MNWKIVATLIIGAVFVTACGASQQQAASPPEESGGMKREAVVDEAPPGGDAAVSTSPNVQPAAKKPVVVHD